MPARILLCLVCAVLLFACTGENKEARKPAQRSALVTLAVSETKDVPYMIEAVGTVEPSATVNIVSRTGGELQQVLIKDGEHVQKGQLLFVIEKEPYEIALHQAKARLESDRAKLAKAQDDYARALKMKKGGFSSAAETDATRVTMVSAQADVREDEAALEKAELDLSYCEIRAPMDGRAGDIKVDRGNVLTAQTLLVVLDAFQPADITFSIPEKHLPLVRRNVRDTGLQVAATSKGGDPIEGDVIFVGNVDADTGTVPLKARFANSDVTLWPGEFLRVRLKLDTRKNAVTVPSRAVLLGPDGPFVYVVGNDKTARIRLVTTDVENDGVTVISSGLSQGESVVLEGHVRLKDGMPIRLHEPALVQAAGERL
ncbi:efflux RND transporter periplasmic adaptor subunit [Mailhella massiliensis]|uniref:Efflux RND transporter periplasmic adaptor subunit n=1 Tax=Mailhella massiliensis TaxID=1903261 RepID=A0A921AXS5_9BACT|nr:efflux RND transporter periplasmic adaptor subunit [Mailhella massiliensis]HJD98280.1 efflux RND transporter periplasmic adaptor subunit [Mailhella massiliensis]